MYGRALTIIEFRKLINIKIYNEPQRKYAFYFLTRNCPVLCVRGNLSGSIFFMTGLLNYLCAFGFVAVVVLFFSRSTVNKIGCVRHALMAVTAVEPFKDYPCNIVLVGSVASK